MLPPRDPPKKITVVTSCSLIARDLFAIAKFLLLFVSNVVGKGIQLRHETFGLDCSGSGIVVLTCSGVRVEVCQAYHLLFTK